MSQSMEEMTKGLRGLSSLTGLKTAGFVRLFAEEAHVVIGRNVGFVWGSGYRGTVVQYVLGGCTCGSVGRYAVPKGVGICIPYRIGLVGVVVVVGIVGNYFEEAVGM